MNVSIIPYPYCSETSRFTANQVMNIYGTAIFCKYGNSYIAIVTHGRMINSLTHITIVKKTKVSMNKQIMQMQMGKVPKQYINMNETRRIHIIPDTEIENHRYKLYELN